MFSVKLIIWFSIYFIFYIIFSLNTLISVFCFMFLILFVCFFLFQLYLEYLTYLILLLYLGGILIFFLFTALMLNKEYETSKVFSSFSIENIFFALIFIKCFFLLTTLNVKFLIILSKNNNVYSPMHIENNYFYNDFISSQNDIISLLGLYTEKSISFLILGLLLLYVMIGSIIITRSKDV